MTNMPMTALALAALIMGAEATTGALATEPAGSTLVPSGTTALPSGQYLVTSLETGQTVFVYVNAKGQMLSQEPKLMHISAQHGQIPGSTPPPAATAPTATAAPVSGAASTTTGTASTTTPPAAGAAASGSLMQQVQQKAQDPKFRSDLQSKLQKELKRQGPKIEREIKKLLR